MNITTVSELPKKARVSKYDSDIDDVFKNLAANPEKVYHISDAGVGLMARFYKRKKECPGLMLSPRPDGLYVSLRGKK